MNTLGLSAGYHDAAATLIDPFGNILFASHSERWSRIKNDSTLDQKLISKLSTKDIKNIAWYERPWMHNLQQIRSGQMNLGPWSLKSTLEKHTSGDFIKNKNIKCWPHHLSHAAAAFQTSPFNRAAVVVIDAIGELDTVSIYHAEYDECGYAKYRRLWHQTYPHSLGLFYSAVTKHLGLKPQDEEYITMGMSAYGTPLLKSKLENLCIDNIKDCKFKLNLHQGFDNIDLESNADLAASAQELLELMISEIMLKARELTGLDCLAYGGGVALNCLANRLLGSWFDRIWIMPSPGDAGSSLGAAALTYGKKIHWVSPYLGSEISGSYPIDEISNHLLKHKIAGVASGPAEFGPRALGNRSLLADPRGSDIKDRVNTIKQRQKFRPFAPAILSEFVHEYFDLPRSWSDSDYMQVVAKCKYPNLFPAVVHVDGSSRVQTVPPTSSSKIRQLLELWYKKTGCPMLLNTSLNVRGEPIVNSRQDADMFESMYGVKVFS